MPSPFPGMDPYLENPVLFPDLHDRMIAYLSEALHPRSIFMGLSRQNLMRQSFKYFLLGEGEVGLRVYAILQKYWEATPQDDVRPCIFLMSD